MLKDLGVKTRDIPTIYEKPSSLELMFNDFKKKYPSLDNVNYSTIKKGAIITALAAIGAYWAIKKWKQYKKDKEDKYHYHYDD